MDLVEGPRALLHVEPVAPPLRQRVDEVAGPFEGLGDQRRQVPRVEAGLLRLGVDGDDATGLVADEVDDGIRHLAPALVGVDAPEEDGLPPDRQLLRPPRLVEEGALEVAGAVEDVDLDERSPVPRAPAVHPLDTRQHHGLVTHLEVSDRRLLGAVEIAARIVREEVEHGLDLHEQEGLGRLLPHALQDGDGKFSKLGQPPAGGHSTENRYGYNGWPPWWTSTLASGRCSATHSVM